MSSIDKRFLTRLRLIGGSWDVGLRGSFALASSFSSKTPVEALGRLRVTADLGIVSGGVVSLVAGWSTTGWVLGLVGSEVAAAEVVSGTFFSSFTVISPLIITCSLTGTDRGAVLSSLVIFRGSSAGLLTGLLFLSIGRGVGSPLALGTLAESDVSLGREADPSSLFPFKAEDSRVGFASVMAGLDCGTALGSGLAAPGKRFLMETRDGDDGEDGTVVFGALMERRVVLRCREKGLGVIRGLDSGPALKEPP